MPIDALIVLCVQLTRDLFAIAKFLFYLRVANWTSVCWDHTSYGIQHRPITGNYGIKRRWVGKTA